MLFADYPVLVRGGGDLGTGVIVRLVRSGFPVFVTELERPLAVRRRVAVAAAVTEGSITIEGVRAVRVQDGAEARAAASRGDIPVLVSEGLADVGARIVVDARLAKRNIDTRLHDAEYVIALGPGFIAGVDCHVVIETARGHQLGRIIEHGSALADTGVPDSVDGRGAERVLRSPAAGSMVWTVEIGDRVRTGQAIGSIGGTTVHAPFDGIVRGLIDPSTPVQQGLKVGDIDPRLDTSVNQVSDKAFAVGGGVLEAVLAWISART